MIVSESPRELERVANHPKVYSAVSCKGCGRISFMDAWARCIGLEFGDCGGFVYVHLEPGTWEVHTLFLPRTRGVDEYAEQSLRHMFDVVGAERIVTMVPADLPHARRFARRHGFVLTHITQDGWERDSGPVDLHHFELSKEEWQCQQQQSA